jgi:hypothetical protein
VRPKERRALALGFLRAKQAGLTPSAIAWPRDSRTIKETKVKDVKSLSDADDFGSFGRYAEVPVYVA